MHFGSHIYIGPGARITANEGFFAGDHFVAGPGLLVVGGNHNIATAGRYMLEVKTGGVNLPVRVEDDVHLGARVTLLKGVVIGEGSVIGACSVVTKSIPPYTVAAGSPCRELRPRFSSEELKGHLSVVRSRYAYDDVVDLWRAAGFASELIDGE
jgi:Acetyltransferase (isoleucine patch superfamily)